jgi:hypothetical protein
MGTTEALISGLAGFCLLAYLLEPLSRLCVHTLRRTARLASWARRLLALLVLLLLLQIVKILNRMTAAGEVK